MSILVSSVLYTLYDRVVSDNKYIPIFITWLAHLLKYADLQKGDALRITIDKDTHDYLKRDGLYNAIFAALPCEHQILLIERPKTHAEGMMSRFIYEEYQQSVFMYCDIDIMIKKPLRILSDGLSNNMLAVHAEGTLADSNYNMLIPDEIKKNGSNYIGFSSGKFLLNSHELCRDFFQIINSVAARQSIDEFYAPDQYVYNYAIYCLPRDKYTINMDILKYPTICTNGHGEQPEKTVLLDLMGEPGNGNLHFEKIFNELVMYFIKH